MEKLYIRVKKNDNLINISNRFNVPLLSLIYDNHLYEEVSEGDVLYLKTYKTYKVLPSDTFFSVAKKFNMTVEMLKSKNYDLPYLFYGCVLNI